MEIMLSISILVIISTAILPTVVWLIARGRSMADENRAAWLLQEGAEVTYNTFLGDWAAQTTGVFHPAVSMDTGSDKWILLPDGETDLEARFSRKIEIKEVCRDLASGEMQAAPCTVEAPVDGRSFLATTTVSWLEAGSNRSINSSLLLTKYSK